jgi:hypothetical protein
MSRSHTAAIARYRRLADSINAAMSGVPAGWQQAEQPTLSAYQARVDRWHTLMSELYVPLNAARESALRGDWSARQALVTFLEADVYCHRSGYFKADAISALTRQTLTAAERTRLIEVVLAAVKGADRREFRSYVRLARAVDDPDLRSRLETLCSSADRRTARHARWVLEGLGARAREPDVMRHELLSSVFALLGLAQKGQMSARDVASVLATANAAPGESDHLAIRTALMSLAADLEAIEAGGTSKSGIADARERFEASLRAFVE